jgi:hypothetical protein
LYTQAIMVKEEPRGTLDAVTRLLEPLKESALPKRPAVTQVAPTMVPLTLSPDTSRAVVPLPSSKA